MGCRNIFCNSSVSEKNSDTHMQGIDFEEICLQDIDLKDIVIMDNELVAIEREVTEVFGGDYVGWLVDASMLHSAEVIGRRFSGSRLQWGNPYALPRSSDVSLRASVWFTSYPASTITREGESIIQSLGDEGMWDVFREIGIEGIHTGPLELAGGVRDRAFTPSVDGGFDRIGIQIDPAYGTDEDFLALAKTAEKYGAMVAGDIVPGHTGKGPDFQLALMNYGEYPGLFNMIEIDRSDWEMLPSVPAGRDSMNLSLECVERLIEAGYLAGTMERVIFYEKGVKETNWSVTPPVKGVDGTDRRWVYLHYFKEGQPTLNWLDPSGTAAKLIAGDVINSLTHLGAKILRLDANGFLGNECTPGSCVGWSEGHPLSVTASNLVAMMIRKYGGFSFQELNLTLEDIKTFSEFGADMSYDFVTRPAYIHALITGDAEFLRMMLQQMHKYKINPASLIHALQNHDEITYELIHFIAHGDELYPFHGEKIPGSEYRVKIRDEAEEKVVRGVPYNLVTCNGICSTMAGIAAASLNIKDPYNMGQRDKEYVKRAHLLLALYNAMQPGVLALSGWDLVGALPVRAEQVRHLLGDGDNRWVNRGSYDLMGYNREASQSEAGLPRAVCLYDSLPEQLKDKNSFASRLKHILEVRKRYGINLSEQIAVPDTQNPGVVIMIHKLPDRGGYQATVINFGRKAAEETIKVQHLKNLQGVEVLTEKKDARANANGEVTFKLGPLEGKVVLFRK